MSVTLSLGIYFVMWWVIFMALLPFGIRAQNEDGAAVVPGTPASAPQNPLLLRKVLWCTLLTSLLFATFYWAVEAGHLKSFMLWFDDVLH
ncbi:DUF1467 family protein [Polycladidibacter stylochi]|uniref:DUF1467 family protein n=1 Tax=Polycladidibacter stylochi TaxID=1807766 RepID=UPI000833D838|nr:DUF1467 family protein [Pseudovibrio stylochi]